MAHPHEMGNVTVQELKTPSASRHPILDKLIDFAPDSMIVVDRHGNIAEINDRTEQMFGFGCNEIVGQAIETLVPERFREEHIRLRQDFSAAPASRPMGVGLPLLARRKDGSEFPVDIMLSPADTADGPIVLAVVRDVTEQRQAQERLHASEQQLLALIDNVRDYAIFLLDINGRIQSWNAGAERIKGYQATEIIGRNFSCFYPPDDVERGEPQEALRRATVSGRFEAEGWRLRKDGSRFWANVILTALRDKQNQLVGFAKVTRDFSDRKQAQDALLLQLCSVLISHQDVQALLSAISDAIQQVVPHNSAGIAIPDPVANVLRTEFLKPGQGRTAVLPLDDTAAGTAFNTREPLVLRSLNDSRFGPQTFAHLTASGIRSACWLPLIRDNRAVAVLMVGSEREGGFTAHHLEILSHILGHIAIAVDNALAFRHVSETSYQLANEKRYLEEELNIEKNFDEIIGKAPALKRVLKQVETVAATEANVLILGETGTGKEMIARAIHRLSNRQERTFVKLNCAAIPSGLLESELFGYEKGAFTGALSQKVGRLELAHRGTLFLDEVGDIPLELQPKLLRALQEREFERLGSTRTMRVDIRLVAATNRDLDHMVERGEFRRDLYYRLRVFPVVLPPLRERRVDIPLLVRYFVDKHARNLGKSIQTIPPDVMQVLINWHWPGNIRELENFLERAVILSKGEALTAPLAELTASDRIGAGTEATTTLETIEKEHIIRILREAKGVISGPIGAAVRLGVPRTTLNAKLKKLGIDRKTYS